MNALEEGKNVLVVVKIEKVVPDKQSRLAEENSVIMKNFADMTELPPIMQNIFSDMAI